MEDIVDGNTVKCVYYSLDEFADAAERRYRPDIDKLTGRDHWAGGDLYKVIALARSGWDEDLAEALALAESVVDTVEKNHEIKTFQPVWDVQGAEVDVARYLSGEPENMVDYPMLETSKHGRVITLCGSISYSSSIDADVIKRRGMVLCALALLLSRIGYASELWINMHAERNNGIDIKVLVKGTNDTLDPSRVMFAYAHPGTLRRLMFAVMHGVPQKFIDGCGIGGGYGHPSPPVDDLPEGTIYLPELRSSRNMPDAHEELKSLLRQMNLLAE